MLAATDVANMIRDIESDLEARTNNDPTILSITPKTWPSSALGCPGPGEVAATVLTNGYKIRFGAGSSVHDYHTRGSQNFRYCP